VLYTRTHDNLTTLEWHDELPLNQWQNLWNYMKSKPGPSVNSAGCITTPGVELMLNPEFRSAFEAAKARIRQMDFRFVEECDQNTQALLEIYCTLALNARYNDFNTR